ncbi:Thioredoxin reductase aclT [Frankliniella fusca]|uniref:Thioredoxin reductase aclT n=1 Tax=Frankliniella fusca TaxID=407009 RepID=A0AAE1HYM8_9NEOP|nr:Thioredoxin reductase aclT [Frankliniella fusca]
MEIIKPLTPGDNLEAQWKYLKWQFEGYILFDPVRAAWTSASLVTHQFSIHPSILPHYHQSNGLAERAVGIVKSFLKKNSKDPKSSLQTCLLQYRITPLSGLGASPAQLLMNRQLRSTIPVHDHCDKNAIRKEIEFSPSDYVYMQNPLTQIWEPGIIVEKCDEPRSYLVKHCGSSNVVRRNVKHLKPNNSEFKSSQLSARRLLLLQSNDDVAVNQNEIVNENVNQNEVVNDNVQINLNQVNANLNMWRDQVRQRLNQNAPTVVHCEKLS